MTTKNKSMILPAPQVSSDQQHIFIGNAPNVTDQNSYVIRCDKNKDWMRWKYDSNTTEIRLSNIWTRIKTEDLYNKHPLDFGNTLDIEGKEDLNEIVAQYEKHIRSSPWLQKLRQEYNDVLEKRKLFDAIKGDNDAKN